MNILFLIGKYPNYGGTEKVTTILANEFAKRGYRVLIASFDQVVPELQSELHEQIKLIKLRYPVLSFHNAGLLKKWVQQNAVDLIINQWCLPFYTNWLCRFAIRGSHCKIISVLHGVPNQNKKLLTLIAKSKQTTNPISMLFYRTVEKALRILLGFNLKHVYNHSSAYILLSESFKLPFINLARLGHFTEKIGVVENPITLNKRADHSISYKKEPQILYVGRMDRINKCVDRIIEAWQQLYKKHPDWSLVLVGDGPDRAQLEQMVKEQKIDRVDFKGFLQEEPVEFYKRASIGILTSDLEGFGLVIVEGMSYSVVPVVYGSYTAVYDIIENGVNGFITTKPYKAQNTVTALDRLMTNTDKRVQMAENAKRTSTRYSLQKIVSHWEDLFHRIL